MIIVNGHTYLTITDAARQLGVSAKTVRSYISQKIIPEPPIVQYGNRRVKHFSLEYMEMAEKLLEQHRIKKNANG